MNPFTARAVTFVEGDVFHIRPHKHCIIYIRPIEGPDLANSFRESTLMKDSELVASFSGADNIEWKNGLVSGIFLNILSPALFGNYLHICPGDFWVLHAQIDLNGMPYCNRGTLVKPGTLFHQPEYSR